MINAFEFKHVKSINIFSSIKKAMEQQYENSNDEDDYETLLERNAWMDPKNKSFLEYVSKVQIDIEINDINDVAVMLSEKDQQNNGISRKYQKKRKHIEKISKAVANG